MSRIRYRDLAVHACSVAQLCLTLCEPVDCSLPGSAVHGISEANPMRTGVSCHILFQEIFPTPGIEPMSPVSPALAGGFFITMLPGKPIEISVQFSHSVVSNSLRPHESQHARPPCPSPTPGAFSDSCPSSR